MVARQNDKHRENRAVSYNPNVRKQTPLEQYDELAGEVAKQRKEKQAKEQQGHTNKV
jgi:hypothetical protein